MRGRESAAINTRASKRSYHREGEKAQLSIRGRVSAAIIARARERLPRRGQTCEWGQTIVTNVRVRVSETDFARTALCFYGKLDEMF